MRRGMELFHRGQLQGRDVAVKPAVGRPQGRALERGRQHDCGRAASRSVATSFTSACARETAGTVSTPVPIRDDKTFSIEFDGTTFSSHLSVTGAFDAAGSASGSFTIRASLGSTQCQGFLPWTAAKA